MTQYQKVFEKPEYLKDTTTGALINTDKSALSAYKRQKQLAAEQKAQIEELRSDVTEIKTLLRELLGR